MAGSGENAMRDQVVTRDSDATREAILHATIEQMKRVGEVGIRVASVAREAGVTTGAIYNLFDNRESLIAAAHTQFLYESVRNAQGAQQALRSDDDINPVFDSRYLEGIRWLLTPANLEPGLRWAQAAARAEHNAELAATIAPLEKATLGAVVDQVVAAQQRGWIRADVDARAVAVLNLGAVIGLGATSRVYAYDPGFIDSLLEAWKFFSRGYLPDEVDWWV